MLYKYKKFPLLDYFRSQRVQRFLIGRVVVGMLKRNVEP